MFSLNVHDLQTRERIVWVMDSPVMMERQLDEDFPTHVPVTIRGQFTHVNVEPWISPLQVQSPLWLKAIIARFP